MNKKYWTSKKLKSLVRERRKQLDLLFEYVNADLAEKSTDHIKRRIQDFLNTILVGSPEQCPRLGDAEGDLLASALQKHLCDRFDAIIHNTKLLVEMPLWSVRGSLEFTVENISGRFNERFFFYNIKGGNEISMLKRLIDLALIEIIRDLDFNPRRFHQCPRCGIYYYQPTERDKNCCSTRCSDAIRLQKFRKKRSQLNGNEPK